MKVRKNFAYFLSWNWKIRKWLWHICFWFEWFCLCTKRFNWATGVGMWWPFF